jgi:HSP20 family protein
MAMTRWEPFDSLLPLREAVNHLFEESMVGPAHANLLGVGRVMPLDIFETEEEYDIEVALPGVRPDDVEVTALGSTITIEVTRKPMERSGKTGRYVRKERLAGELTRTIELPQPIKPEHVTATFERGLLLLQVPKSETARPHKITIRTASEKPVAKLARDEVPTR